MAACAIPLQEACYNQSLPMRKRAVRVSPGLYRSVVVPRDHANRLSRTWRMRKISKELKERWQIISGSQPKPFCCKCFELCTLFQTRQLDSCNRSFHGRRDLFKVCKEIGNGKVKGKRGAKQIETSIRTENLPSQHTKHDKRNLPNKNSCGIRRQTHKTSKIMFD